MKGAQAVHERWRVPGNGRTVRARFELRAREGSAYGMLL